jgi:ubiquitin carboxyl-terminal hydrolase L5
MINADATEEDEYSNRQKKKTKTSKSRPTKKTASSESAFHFVAYMPIGGEIWRLDGLDAYPQKFGPCGPDNWLDLIIGPLQDRMAGALECNLLALIRDPLTVAINDLAYSITFQSAIEARLSELIPNWHALADPLPEDFIASPDEAYFITQPLLDSINLSTEDRTRLARFDVGDADALLHLREKNARGQGALRATVTAEKRAVEMDEEKAVDRRNDYGPVLQRWFMMLAENGRLRELHESL